MRIGRHLGQWARASPSPNDARERLGRIGEVWPAAAGGVRKGCAIAGVDGACAQTLASTPKPATCHIPRPTGLLRTALLTPQVGENGAAATISLRAELGQSLLDPFPRNRGPAAGRVDLPLGGRGGNVSRGGVRCVRRRRGRAAPAQMPRQACPTGAPTRRSRARPPRCSPTG